MRQDKRIFFASRLFVLTLALLFHSALTQKVAYATTDTSNSCQTAWTLPLGYDDYPETLNKNNDTEDWWTFALTSPTEQLNITVDIDGGTLAEMPNFQVYIFKGSCSGSLGLLHQCTLNKDNQQCYFSIPNPELTNYYIRVVYLLPPAVNPNNDWEYYVRAWKSSPSCNVNEVILDAYCTPFQVSPGGNTCSDGTMSGTGSCTVTYHWEVFRPDGTTWQSPDLTTPISSGTGSISQYCNFPTSQEGDYSAWVKTTSPNFTRSTGSTYEVVAPFTVASASVNDFDPQTPTQGTTTTSSGSIVGTGSGTVEYEWRVTGPTSSWTSGMLYTTMTRGSANIPPYSNFPTHELWAHSALVHVFSPDSLDSNTKQYSVRPPLTIASFDTQPRKADPGKKITAMGTIRNGGSINAPPMEHLIFVNNGDDGKRFTWRSTPREKINTPMLEPGRSHSFEVEIQVPENLPSGWDYLCVLHLDWQNIPDDARNLYNSADSPIIALLDRKPRQLGPRNTSSNSGDPVNTALGNFTYEKTDLFIPGRGLNIKFTRYYNSLGGLDSPMGLYWNHSYNIHLHVDTEDGIQTGALTVAYGDGKRHRYTTPDGYEGYVPPAGIYDTLTPHPIDSTYHLYNSKTHITYIFDSLGHLKEIFDTNNNTVNLQYTGNNLTKIIDTVGREIVIQYTNFNGTDRITSIKGPVRPAVTYGYDTYGNLANVSDARSKTTQYVYHSNHDDKHLLWKIINPRGKEAVENYYGAPDGAEDGKRYFVVRQLDADDNQTLYRYDLANKITTITDPAGKITKHYYDDKFRFIKEEDPLLKIAEFHFDADENMDWVKDKNLNTTWFTYDDRGNVLTKTDPKGVVTKFEYDGRNNLTTKIEAFGTLNYTWIYTYDEGNNLLTETDANGGMTTYTYVNGQVETKRDANGHNTQYFYEDGEANLTKVVNALGCQTTYWYDGASRKTHSTDAMMNETAYHYDENDNLLWIDDTYGNRIWYTYDENSNRTSVKNRLGYTTEYTYDNKDRLNIVKNALGHELITTYDAFDRKKTVTDQWGNLSEFSYDEMGNLIKVTNPNLESTNYEYDWNGNRIKMLDPAGEEWHYGYDENNRMIWQSDPYNNITSYEYNGLGWRVKITDPKSQATRFEYDKVGRLAKVLDPEGGESGFQYDGVGNRIEERDARFKTIKYEFDELNRLKKTIDRNANETIFGYDCLNMISKTNGNGETISFTEYDRDGRLKRKNYPDGSVVSFTYDLNGNLKEMVDSLGTTLYTYDELDRLLSVQDAFGRTVSYSYDLAANKRTITYPDNKQVINEYDKLGRLAKVTDWTGFATTYSYDTRGNLKQVVNSTGTKVEYSYDDASRLIGASDKTSTDSTISSFQFTLDENGNRTGMSMNVPLAPTFDNKSITASYDPENQIISWGTDTFQFDKAGRQIRKSKGAATTNYSYTHEDLLESVSEGTTSIQYRYNGAGHRLSRVENKVETRYTLDLNGDMSKVLCETDAAGNIKAYYVYGDGLLYKVTPSGQRHHYHFDALGSTLALTNDSENMTDKYAYDPFGKLTNLEGSSSNPYRYVGKYGVMYEGNDLLFMRARFYDMETRRFVSRDPVHSGASNAHALNYYLYSHNNPVSFGDPKGEQAIIMEMLKIVSGIARGGASAATDDMWGMAKTEASLAANLVSYLASSSRVIGWAKFAGKALDFLGLCEASWSLGKGFAQGWQSEYDDPEHINASAGAYYIGGHIGVLLRYPTNYVFTGEWDSVWKDSEGGILGLYKDAREFLTEEIVKELPVALNMVRELSVRLKVSQKTLLMGGRIMAR